MRTNWIAKRQSQDNVTQNHYARQNIITEAMDYVAQREDLPAEVIRAEDVRNA